MESKFTKEQLEAALAKFTAFTTDSFADGMGEECDTPEEFIRVCLEVFLDE